MKNNKMQIVRLTESELNKIVQESVKRILKETKQGKDFVDVYPYDNIDKNKLSRKGNFLYNDDYNDDYNGNEPHVRKIKCPEDNYSYPSNGNPHVIPFKQHKSNNRPKF